MTSSSTASAASTSTSTSTTAAKLPRLERFAYERVIEWGGDHVQTRLELERQADGTYLAAVSGEQQVDRKGVVVREADLLLVRLQLERMQSFPTSSFAGHGNHWFTDIQIKGTHPSGKPWDYRRHFYDANDARISHRAGELEKAVEDLIKTLGKKATTKHLNPFTQRIKVYVGTLKARVTGPAVSGPSVGVAGVLKRQ
jgi:hypothetical protein